MIAQYKGYDIYRNLLSKSWYAYPTCSITTEGKITASTSEELRAKIDAVATDYQPNPWQLPSQPRLQIVA